MAEAMNGNETATKTRIAGSPGGFHALLVSVARSTGFGSSRTQN